MPGKREMDTSNWNTWHLEYDDPESELVGRLNAVQRHVSEVVEACPPGPVTVVSICGGQGREVIGALADHPRRPDVRGRLVELDPDNAASARQRAKDAGLDLFEVVTGDASVSASYEGLPPADLVVLSGVFGHLDDPDQVHTIEFLTQICKSGAAVVWTSYLRVEGRAERLRQYFVEQGFDEVVFERIPGDDLRFTVALSRYAGSQQQFARDATIFEFGSSRKRRGGQAQPA
jgi:hypothetical protein